MNAKKILESADVDAVVIYNGSNEDLNFYYFTRLLYGGIFEGSLAVISEEGVKVITSILEEQSAKKGSNEVLIYRTGEEREKLLREAVGSANRIGLNYASLSMSDFNRLKKIMGEREYVDVSEKIMEMRMIKDEEELKNMREAAKIASEVADIMPDFMKEGIREYELAARLGYEMFRRGAEDFAFTTIMAFGENAAEPHYLSGARKLKRGDFVLMDFGARYHHYNSDITRTFVFGRASEEQKEMYYTVLEAQRIGIEMLRAGVNGRDVDMKVKEYINSTKYKDRMIHSTGHGLGLAVHDHIGLTSLKDLILKENMVVTVEPGVYIPGFGGVRIEDDVRILKDGVEVLTSAKKNELIEV
ncbi:MAG: aminopeptidase P family protein [Euryarchaeota archaeon]|nr:aminopeptidase P family protein [Euryarchaeota archaeon]